MTLACVTYAGVPGVVETREELGETTLVVDPARLVEACTVLRDEPASTSSPTSPPPTTSAGASRGWPATSGPPRGVT